jgi:hypothetical protein
MQQVHWLDFNKGILIFSLVHKMVTLHISIQKYRAETCTWSNDVGDYILRDTEEKNKKQ